MSKLKFYDNGSIAAAGNVATGYSSNLLLGNRNIAARYKETYHGADLDYLMYIENDVYYFAMDMFLSNGTPESAPYADSVILQHTPEHFYEGVFDLTEPYETSTFISTGNNPMKNAVVYYGFKLAEGPALTNASGYFEWLTVMENSDGAIVNGIDNASVGSNLVMGWDNRVNGTYNTIMTQHATVDGDYNYIKTAQQYTPLRARVDFKGSFNILVNAGLFTGFNGSYNYVHGDNGVFGSYNLVFGDLNNVGNSNKHSGYNGIIGCTNQNFGDHSIILGSTGTSFVGVGSSIMGKLATYNTNLSDYSYIIGTDNFNGLRGVRIKTLKASSVSQTFDVTLKDKATFQSGVIYIFYYGSWSGVYGKYKTSSTSNGVTTYTFTFVTSSGTTTMPDNSLNYDFSSDTSPVYWHCVFPYGAPHIWSSGEGVLLPMNSTATSTTLATTPVNDLPTGGQVYGLGSITIGHNNVNVGSRSILIGNDLGGSASAGDKVIRIGNGTGVSYTSAFLNYTIPYLSTGFYDGDGANAYYNRQVILENKFTDSKYNSTLSMTYQGIAYTSLSHTFTCTSVSSTSNKIALNAPLTLSSSYTYGTTLPTTYLQSGRIFFLI